MIHISTISAPRTHTLLGLAFAPRAIRQSHTAPTQFSPFQKTSAGGRIQKHQELRDPTTLYYFAQLCEYLL